MNFIIQIRLKEEVAIKSTPFSQLRLVRKSKNENNHKDVITMVKALLHC